jgi:hypothetical protein
MPEINNFEEWKSYLDDRLKHAKKEGFSDELISDLSYEMGGYLAKELNPDIPENKFLLQLWNVASTEERHAIANLMLKLVQR